jgi:methionyl-tRNA formyltransferase
LDAGIDTGDILVQRCYPIEPDETGFELYGRSMSLGAQIFAETFEDIASGKVKPRKQDGPGSFYGTFPRRQELCWRSPRRWIRNQIRAHALPYYPAFSFLGNKCVLFHRVSLVDVPGFQAQGPGRIIEVREGGTFVVTCADGCLLVEDCSVVPLADGAPTASYFRPNQRFELGGGP